MAFVGKFGNLPILESYYNVTLGSGTLINDGGVIMQNVVNSFNDAPHYIREHALRFGVIDVDLWDSEKKLLMSVDLSPKNVLTGGTTLKYGVINKHNTFGEWVADLGFHANPNLNLLETPFGAIPNNWTLYGFAVLCYSDAIGANLVGVDACFVMINDVAPEQYWITNNAAGALISLGYLDNAGYKVEIKSSDEDYGDESTSDGYGQTGTPPAFNHESDIVSIPDVPAVSTSSVGFIHLYKVNQSSLATLSQYLFPDVMTELQNIIAQLPVALADLPNVLVPMLRAFASIFAYRDSVQYIIDLHAIPCPPSIGGNDYIKVGALSTDISVPVITSDYVDIDCGALSIPEQFKNFLDYIVSCKLFLPFVGFIDIKPELWNGGTIGVKYRFNVIDGSFMAYVTSTSGKSKLTNTVIGQYGGSACLHLPMVAAEYGAIIGGIVQGAMAVDKVSGAGSASQMASAEAGLASALMNFNANPPMQQSNGYNASAGFMGGRTPYLMIEYPVPQFSKTYTHEKGLPLNVNMAFSSLHGYTEIDPNVDLSGINAPVDIIDEIRNALATGTIF